MPEKDGKTTMGTKTRGPTMEPKGPGNQRMGADVPFAETHKPGTGTEAQHGK